MKTKNLILFALMLLNLTACSQTLKDEWETDPVLKVPESVLYNSKKGLLYVSNINGKPAEKNGEGFISILDTKGRVKKLKWATGLNAPKGMDIKDDKLYVSDIDRVAVIDTKTGKVLKFINIPGSVFLNDVAAGPDGNIYVTDTRKGVIYVLKSGVPSVWSADKHLKGVNGITVENGRLLIGSQGYLLRGDTKTGEITVVTKVPIQIDGLIPLGNEKYVVSAWVGKVLYLSPGKEPEELFDSKPLNFHTADMGYIPEKKLLLIPTFTDRVIAKEIVY